MADLTRTTPATRFDSFDIHRTSYKTIGGHAFDANILIPKNLKSGPPHPLFVKWHGGGLVTGEAMFPDWFAGFLVPLIHRTSSIVVLPNYRLLPEHNGKDIFEDLQDFWKWVDAPQGGLRDYLKTISQDIELDLQKIAVGGDSAGGWMALQSALALPEGKVKAIVAHYPMTRELRKPPTENFFGMPKPKPETIDEYVKAIKPGTVATSFTPYAKMDMSYALAYFDRWMEFFGEDNRGLFPINMLESVKSVPPTFIIHGTGDSAVDIEDSRVFKKKVVEVLGEEAGKNVRLAEVEGEEHGFDTQLREEETDWLRDGLTWVEQSWVA